LPGTSKLRSRMAAAKCLRGTKILESRDITLGMRVSVPKRTPFAGNMLAIAFY
jgi:hypothetical protein